MIEGVIWRWCPADSRCQFSVNIASQSVAIGFVMVVIDLRTITNAGDLGPNYLWEILWNMNLHRE